MCNITEPMREEVWNPLEKYTKDDVEERLKNVEKVLDCCPMFLMFFRVQFY